MIQEKEYIIEFKKKNYKFSIIDQDEEAGTINILNKYQNSVLSLDVTKISYFIDKISKKIDILEDEVEEKIIEYIEFIEIITFENQVLTAFEQLSIYLWNCKALSYNFLNRKEFFGKYSNNFDDIKYYYFLLFLLKEVNVVKEYNKSYLAHELDWDLDNIGQDHKNFPEENDITDFIIR
ncbi:hypothetical protein CPAV1605_436 [seawater metagenome]|uniref:Uncharacterized protein n=1 Tax=seawater metagenome TaxID=1561972 RepID=A0A5E8CHJ8_9ZZZZ